MSFFTALGGDIKKLFGWITSPKGQAVLQTGESIVSAVWPGASAVENIFNLWLNRAITVEGVAEQAAQASGTGAQKAAAVIADVTPTVLSIAKQAGLPAPTATTIANVNNYVVAILNELSGKSTTPPAPSAS